MHILTMNKCSGLILASYQTPTKLLSLSPPQKDMGENKMKKLMRWDKEIIYLHHRQNRLDLGKIHLIYFQ